MQKNADPWISHCTLVLSVHRRVCVMGADSFWLFEWLKWKKQRAGKYHFHFIKWLLQEQ